jgi:hypothetical protein
MIQIIDGLFLGNRQSACDRIRLLEGGVTHVVNCTEELPCYFDGEFHYLHLKLRDPDSAFRDCLPRIFSFIDAGRQNGRVLVHCFAAVSRSPATVLAYLCHLGEPFEQAATRLGKLVWTDPDYLFLGQLAAHLGLEHDDESLRSVSELLRGRVPG